MDRTGVRYLFLVRFFSWADILNAGGGVLILKVSFSERPREHLSNSIILVDLGTILLFGDTGQQKMNNASMRDHSHFYSSMLVC